MDVETRDRLIQEFNEDQNLCSAFPLSETAWQPDNPKSSRIKKTNNTGYVNSDIADVLKRILKEQIKPLEKNMMFYDLEKVKKVYMQDSYKDKLDTFDINLFSTAIRDQLGINITNPELDRMETVEEVTNFLDERQSQN